MSLLLFSCCLQDGVCFTCGDMMATGMEMPCFAPDRVVIRRPGCTASHGGLVVSASAACVASMSSDTKVRPQMKAEPSGPSVSPAGGADGAMSSMMQSPGR